MPRVWQKGFSHIPPIDAVKAVECTMARLTDVNKEPRGYSGSAGCFLVQEL